MMCFCNNEQSVHVSHRTTTGNPCIALTVLSTPLSCYLDITQPSQPSQPSHTSSPSAINHIYPVSYLHQTYIYLYIHLHRINPKIAAEHITPHEVQHLGAYFWSTNLYSTVLLHQCVATSVYSLHPYTHYMSVHFISIHYVSVLLHQRDYYISVLLQQYTHDISIP